jgi:hypothetical protein
LYPNNTPIYIDKELDDKDVDFESGQIIYNKNKKKGSKKLKIIDKDEHFFPAVRINSKDTQMTDKIYICGPGGVGKSFKFIRPYIIQYHQVYPNNSIYLFSSKAEDIAIDDLNYVKRVEIDDDIIDNKIELNQIKNSLCIFDDIENFGTKKITQAVLDLLNEILINGRSYLIFCLYVNHLATDYKKTRNLINEANKVVIFPIQHKDGYDYFLDKHYKINDINKKIIKNCNSNFVCLSKEGYIISNKYILT